MPRWDRLPQNIKGIITVASSLVAIVATSFAVGAATVGYKDLPARMDSAEDRLEKHDTALVRLQRVDSLSAENRRILAAMADTTAMTWCVVRAQALGNDPQRACLYGER